MKCSSKFIYLDKDSKLPIRLKYYQGPRNRIALTLMMRKVTNSFVSPGKTDPMCDEVVVDYDFTSILQTRDWFIPNQDSLSFPSLEQMEVLN